MNNQIIKDLYDGLSDARIAEALSFCKKAKEHVEKLESSCVAVREALNQLSVYRQGVVETVVFYYLKHLIVITPDTMQIGYMKKTHAEWEAIKASQLWDAWYPENELDWERNREWLLGMCRAHALYFKGK